MNRVSRQEQFRTGSKRNLTGLKSVRSGQNGTGTEQGQSFLGKKQVQIGSNDRRPGPTMCARASAPQRKEDRGVFPLLLTLSLVLVAGSSIYMSVYGLMAVFSEHSKIIFCTGLGMEIGKILVVSHLYRNWSELRWIPRGIFAGIILVLVVLTSVEIMGFLSQSHVHATNGLRTAEADLDSLARETAILRDQISVFDTTLEGLPKGHVTRRIDERNKWGYQEKQARLLEIENQETLLRIKVIQERQSAGPVFAVARIMGLKDEHAISCLILLLVLILEPLSIGLTVAVNAVWADRKPPQEEIREDQSLNQEFLDFVSKHNLTVEQIAKITNRRRLRTCQEWLDGKTPVPKRAVRAVREWAIKNS